MKYQTPTKLAVCLAGALALGFLQGSSAIADEAYYIGDDSGYAPPTDDFGYVPTTDAGGHPPAQGACGHGCGGCQSHACRRRGGGLWLDADLLLWWRQSRSAPPLATSNLAGDLPVLSDENTIVLFGGEGVGGDLELGWRVNGGYWFDPCQTVGIGGGFFSAGTDEEAFNTSTTGVAPVLGIPFFNVAPGEDAEDALLLSFPGVSSDADLSIRTENEVYGADLYLRRALHRDSRWRIDVLGGYQFYNIDDHFNLNAAFTSLDVAPGARIEVADSFDMDNEFHGGMIGLAADHRSGCWSFKAQVQAALGTMRREAEISGSQTTTDVGGGVDVTAGGLFAQPSQNIGEFDDDEFTIVPELNLSLGYRATRNLDLGVGYSFIYWHNVWLASEQIDRNINASQFGDNPLVGDPAPSFPARDSSFWVQGLTFSAQLHY